MKKVTVRDVAALAGVSSSTVSRVLNNHPTISPKTQKIVRDACKALNYVPDIAAKGLAGHETHTIGIIVPDISNPYFSALCTAAERYAAERNYRVILTNTLHNPAYELDAVDQMLSQRVDGVLISACSPDSQILNSAMLGETPCVYLGSNHGPNCSYVEIDNERGAYEATQYLYLLGHRRIVFLGGRLGSRTLEQRLAGYRRSMTLNNLPPREMILRETGGSLKQWCGEQAFKLFQAGDIPDAFLAYSDMIAMRILDAAESFDLHCPEDFSIVGFDNIMFSHLPPIGLTSVSQQKFTAGRLAVKRLLEKINGECVQTADILEPELVIRSTCRKIE